MSELSLRTYDADPARVERIRARCVAALGARRRAAEAPPRAAAWRTWLEPAFALSLGALYLAEAVARVVAAYR